MSPWWPSAIHARYSASRRGGSIGTIAARWNPAARVSSSSAPATASGVTRSPAVAEGLGRALAIVVVGHAGEEHVIVRDAAVARARLRIAGQSAAERPPHRAV